MMADERLDDVVFIENPGDGDDPHARLLQLGGASCRRLVPRHSGFDSLAMVG
jgi:hypothetical protein